MCRSEGFQPFPLLPLPLSPYPPVSGNPERPSILSTRHIKAEAIPQGKIPVYVYSGIEIADIVCYSPASTRACMPFCTPPILVYAHTLQRYIIAFFRHRLDKRPKNQYNIWAIGVWRSLVSRLVRVQEASGSNPDTPTNNKMAAKSSPFIFSGLRNSKGQHRSHTFSPIGESFDF